MWRVVNLVMMYMLVTHVLVCWCETLLNLKQVNADHAEEPPLHASAHRQEYPAMFPSVTVEIYHHHVGRRGTWESLRFADHRPFRDRFLVDDDLRLRRRRVDHNHHREDQRSYPSRVSARVLCAEVGCRERSPVRDRQAYRHRRNNTGGTPLQRQTGVGRHNV